MGNWWALGGKACSSWASVAGDRCRVLLARSCSRLLKAVSMNSAATPSSDLCSVLTRGQQLEKGRITGRESVGVGPYGVVKDVLAQGVKRGRQGVDLHGSVA